MASSKQDILDELLQEYNNLKSNQLDKKFELGKKIQSVKLELDKTIMNSIHSLDE